MKIITFELGRSTMLFPLEEVVPLAGTNGRAIAQKIKEKYEFIRLPDFSLPREETAKTGHRFENGKFNFQGESANISDLSVYGDGVVVTANTTERADAFIKEIISLLRDQFSFRDFITKPRQHYLSQIVAEFEEPLGHLVPLNKISEAIIKYANPTIQKTNSVDFARIDFELDSAGLNQPIAIPRFVMERRVGASFDQERYICVAPMETQNHVKALEDIEKILS